MKRQTFFSIFGVVCLMAACRSLVITTIDPDLFEKTLDLTSDAQLVDVRTYQEYIEGHLSGAILMDIRESTFDSLTNQLDRSRPVFVYCRSGKRSLDAANMLEKNKFKIVYNLDGGIIAWKDKGKTVTIREE